MREVADKVHGVGPGRCVRGGLGEAANFVGVGAGAELFVLKGSAGGWIDDRVRAGTRSLELRSEIYCVERGGDATCGLAAVTKMGLVLVRHPAKQSRCCVTDLLIRFRG
jgi:hypothetical protein